ncbi:MAG: transposase [Gemmatimonadetes bacterium]|nr:transposase [Gemmatimonadota bacterium]MYB97549.1 transposase [Gemmatimonadota bacterium]
MAGNRERYSPELRRHLVELVRSGRRPRSLAREFEPSEQTIRNWVKQADLDEGRRGDGIRTEVRAELRRLKRDNKRLRVERKILRRAAAWFADEKKAGDSLAQGGRRDPRAVSPNYLQSDRKRSDS